MLDGTAVVVWALRRERKLRTVTPPAASWAAVVQGVAVPIVLFRLFSVC